MTKVVMKAFAVALTTGTQQFRPGETVDSLHYSAVDFARIDAVGSPYLIPDAGATLAAAKAAAVALRNRGGDPVGHYQASEQIVTASYVADHP